MSEHTNVRWFSELGLADLEEVGGKNSSLGEMVSHLTDLGVRVPDGFATTAGGLPPLHRRHRPGRADRRACSTASTPTTYAAWPRSVTEIRREVVEQPFPEDLEADIRSAYDQLAGESGDEASFAVRSSATAEDLPDASFAGQQETFLNVRGIDAVLLAVREVFASLYNDRAIAYRVHHGFAHADVGLSAGVQKMVRSDIGSSGVMFTMDTESGFDRRGLHHLGLRPRRGRRAGRGQPRRVLRLQAGPARRSAPRSSSAASAARPPRWSTPTTRTVGRTTEFVPRRRRPRRGC